MYFPVNHGATFNISRKLFEFKAKEDEEEVFTFSYEEENTAEPEFVEPVITQAEAYEMEGNILSEEEREAT